MHEPRAQTVLGTGACVYASAVIGIPYGCIAEPGAVPCVDVRLLVPLTCALGHKTTFLFEINDSFMISSTIWILITKNHMSNSRCLLDLTVLTQLVKQTIADL